MDKQEIYDREELANEASEELHDLMQWVDVALLNARNKLYLTDDELKGVREHLLLLVTEGALEQKFASAMHKLKEYGTYDNVTDFYKMFEVQR